MFTELKAAKNEKERLKQERNASVR
jgi:hypothetical protein